MNKSVPFFNYPWLFKHNREKFIEIFTDVSDRGSFILGQDLYEFEEKLADYVGSNYAIGVANATDALQILMMASGLKKGGEVIFCSHTMVATASAIYHAGGVPVPTEVGYDRLIDIDSIESCITENTVAIMPTQLNGRVANMDKIKEIAELHNLDIFEDSAQALGAKYKDQFAGTFGKGGCISFYPAKVLGCFGDAGAVICNDHDIAENVKMLRDHGRGDDGEIVMWGFNSRLDNIQAAFLNYQLDHYTLIIERRREIAAKYNDELRDVEELNLPPEPDIGEHFDVYQNYEILAENRDELKDFLAEKNIGTLVQWGGKAVHQFTELNLNGSLPKTDDAFSRLLMIPLNLTMDDDDVSYVTESIKEFYSKV